MDEIVRRITVVGGDSEGNPAEIVYEKEADEKKTTRLLKPFENVQRRMLESHKVFIDEILSQQEEHSRERKNGWLFDLPEIFFKANKKAMKTLVDW